MTSAGPSERGSGEAGITLILMALAMIGILTIVAIVIDHSNVRNSRQDNKLTADVVVAAGLQDLAADGVPKPWRAACTALDYLRVNQPGVSLTATYKDGSGNPVANPCSTIAVLERECLPNTVAGYATTWAWISVVGGEHTFDIKTGYVTPDPAFPEDAGVYAGDNGDPASGGCDQLAVITSQTDDVLFGGVVGATDYLTASRSVGRVRIDIINQGVPAFLMLERKACDTLSEQVGSGEAGIIVDPASPTDPGIVHVDSSGSPAAGCNGNNNPSGWAVYSSGTGGPKIVANGSADGQPGIMAIHALQVGDPPVAYGGSTAAGLSPAPTPGRVVSRKPIDDKYNPAVAPTISNIHASAAALASRTTAPASSVPAPRPGAWTTLNCSTARSNSAATKIFVNCPGGFSANNVHTYANATDIVFNGRVSIANNRGLFMPAARSIVVGGTTSGGLTVANGGRLGINSVSNFANNSAGVTAACTAADAGTRTTQLVIFGGGSAGALSIAGRTAMCQTFAYLAGPKTTASYTRQELTNGTYDPSCTATKPCAASGGGAATNAFLTVAGSNALVQWSAPDQLTAQPAEGAAGVEDLALWTESDHLNEVKSNGDLRPTGVFFLPNARVEMRSPASATPRDAQFISRSLQLLQGTLRMKPTAGNAVQIPVLGDIGIVR